MSKMTRDKWGALALAGSHLSMGIINRYPDTIRGYVAYQHETAQNTAQVLYEQEQARQAAKKAHRMANRALIGSVAGAALGGIGGVATGVGAMTGMSAGSSIGSGLATGNAQGITSGLSSLAKGSMSIAGGGQMGSSSGTVTYDAAGNKYVNGMIVEYGTGSYQGQ